MTYTTTTTGSTTTPAVAIENARRRGITVRPAPTSFWGRMREALR